MARRVTSATFIGRAAKLEALRLLLRAVREERQGTTVLLAGEAGVGKTRFLAELTARASAKGWTILRGECDEFSAQRPFAALQGMGPAIRDFLASELPGELETHGWRAVSSTWQMAPESATPPIAAGAIAYHVSQLLQAMARVRPLLVVIERPPLGRRIDAHAVRDPRARAGIGAGGARRGVSRGRGSPPASPLPNPRRRRTNSRPERIPLQPFSLDEATELAAAIAAPSVSRMPVLSERSGGNAFLLEELLAAPDGELPAGVAQVVLSRLGTLGQDAVELAEAASLDSTLPLPVLSAASGLGRERFEAACDLLVERGFSRLEPAGMSFRHALIREVVYARIPPTRRMTLHRRAGEAFEEFDARRAGEAARHWQLAGDAPKGLRASVAAAMHATRLGALPEAADLFEYALQVWSSVEEPESIAGIDHAELVVQAARALKQRRRLARAAQLLEAELALPGITPLQRSALLIPLSEVYHGQVPMDRSLAAAREAVDCLDDRHSMNRRLLAMVQFVEFACGGFDRASEAAEMLKRAEEFEDRSRGILSELCFTFMRAAVAVVYGHDSARALLEKMSALSANVPRSTFKTVAYRAMLGDHEWVAAHGIVERDRSFAVGQVLIEGNGLESEIAYSLSRLGRWAESFEVLDRAIRRSGEEPLFEDAPDVVMFGWTLMMVRTGRLDDARRYLHSAWRWAVPVMTHYSMALTSTRVELARMCGDLAESREATSHLLERVNHHFMAMSGEPVALAIAFEADHAFQQRTDPTEALILVDHWIDRLESCLVDAPGRVNLADFGVFLEQCRLERARLAGDDDPARWEDLAETWAALPRPFDAAYARFRAAWALLMGTAPASHRDRQRATAHLVQARATSQELGAVYLERDIESLWQSAGLREERPASAAKTVPKAETGPNLTPREAEVLALMARGDSNGRIAIALDISARTAAVHVSNVIHKFGARTRVEAAMRARDLGLI